MAENPKTCFYGPETPIRHEAGNQMRNISRKVSSAMQHFQDDEKSNLLNAVNHKISRVSGMSVRKFLVGVLTSMALLGANAGEASTMDALPEESTAQAAYTEALVTIAPVPMPAAVVELASYSPKTASAGQSKRVKAATVARARSMLSRSTREQIALASNSAKADDHARLAASDNEDADSGLDELDLHRSFSQPKVARTPDQTADDDDTIDLPEHVKLRLLMARTKAVDAYVLSQAGKASVPDGEELSDTVKLRLQIARLRAVKLHSDTHGTG